MKQFTLLLLALACFTILGCDDDEEPVSPIVRLGRFEGWRVASVESNFATKLDSTLATVPDSIFAQAGTTRTDLRADFETEIVNLYQVDDCDRDDVLFFEQGFMILIQQAVVCPGADDPSVLDPLNGKAYGTDAEVNTIFVRDPATNDLESEYTVTEFTDETITFGQQREFTGNLLVPTFDFSVSYSLVANDI